MFTPSFRRALILAAALACLVLDIIVLVATPANAVPLLAGAGLAAGVGLAASVL